MEVTHSKNQYLEGALVYKRMGTSKMVWANLKRKKECYRKNLDLDVLRLGDVNSRFFHYIMKQRFRRNEVVIFKDSERYASSSG